MSQGSKQNELQNEALADIKAFKDIRGPFVAAVDATRMPMIFTDAKQENDAIVFANDSFCSLLGYERADLLGQSFRTLIGSDNSETALAALNAEFGDGISGQHELRCSRRDGSTFWADIYVSPVRDEAGKIVQHFASFVDLTRFKAAQERSHLLVDELNDRVRNMLAGLQSIVSQAFRKGLEPEACRLFITSRISALARSHALLARDDWGRGDLKEIVATAFQPLSDGLTTSQRYMILGETIFLSPKQTLALGIALHELFLNAVGHGALSNEKGTVTVSWVRTQSVSGKRLLLEWRELNGPVVQNRNRAGFGTRVIKDGLSHEMDAKVILDFPKSGLICQIDLALQNDSQDG